MRGGLSYIPSFAKALIISGINIQRLAEWVGKFQGSSSVSPFPNPISFAFLLSQESYRQEFVQLSIVGDSEFITRTHEHSYTASWNIFFIRLSNTSRTQWNMFAIIVSNLHYPITKLNSSKQEEGYTFLSGRHNG